MKLYGMEVPVYFINFWLENNIYNIIFIGRVIIYIDNNNFKYFIKLFIYIKYHICCLSILNL